MSINLFKWGTSQASQPKYLVTFTELNGLADAEVSIYLNSERTIEIGNSPIQTESGGSATIELPNKTYYYRVKKLFYDNYDGSFTVEDSTVDIDFTLVESIKYLVTFTELNALDGVAVEIRHNNSEGELIDTLITESGGLATIELPNAGSSELYYYKVSKTDWYTEGYNFTVEDSPVGVDFTMKVPVVFQETNNVEDVEVNIYSDSGKTQLVATCNTDETGQFTIELEPAQYWFVTDKVNYDSYEDSYEIIDESDNSVDFTLIEQIFELEIETLSDNKTFTLPLVSSGSYDFTVDWGDGTSDNITTYNQAEATHVYADFSTIYNIKITGNTCTKLRFQEDGRIKPWDPPQPTSLMVTKLLNVRNLGFTHLDFYGCSNLTTISPKLSLLDLDTCKEMFQDCSSLESIPAGIFDGSTRLAADGFYRTFYDCSGLTSIPTDLFRYNTLVSTNGFNGTFYMCSKLTSIPTDLFRYNTLVSTYGFSSTFNRCSGLTSIPTDLFRYNTLVSTNGFYYTFGLCTELTTIPTDLFRYNTLVSTYGFNGTFYMCSKLTSIPTDLFRYNTLVSTRGFSSTFEGCSGLTSIPTDLFRYNTLVSTKGFNGTFHSCSNLESVPELLFKYNTDCDGFLQTFLGCNKLQHNAKIFYDTGEQSTRFLNKTVTFLQCFYRSSFTGTQGTAPDLWNCDFGSGTPTKTNCFAGNGNSITSLTNYNEILQSWGGPLAE